MFRRQPSVETVTDAHRGNVDDEPAASLAKPRQKCLGNGDGAEDVHLELPPHLFDRRLLEHAFMAVAGIVDQHVDRPMLVFRVADDIIDPVELGDVAEGRPQARQGFGERCQRRLRAHGADHPVTGLKSRSSDGEPEAGIRSGDEEGLS